MTQVRAVIHPVSVVYVAFPKTQFERKALPKAGKKMFFPSYTIDVEHDVDYAERFMVTTIRVKSRPAKTAVVSFKFEVQGVFKCTEFDRAEQALREFSSATTPMMLLWPYVRPYLSSQMYHLGLPEYHLPLALRWETVGERVVAKVKGQHVSEQ